MELVTIDVLRTQCKADPSEDAQLTVYGNAAEAFVRKYVNRNVYIDQTALDTARAGVAATMTVAHGAYEDAIEAADALESDLDQQFAKDAALKDLQRAQADAQAIQDGIVTNNAFVEAILLTAAHYYRNREICPVPDNVEWILYPWRAVGPL